MENSEKGTPTEFGLKFCKNCIQKFHQLHQPYQTLLEEEKFSQQKIDNIVKKIPNGKSPEYDGIDNIIVKDNPNRCAPSGHRSSTPPPTNPTKSNLYPSCSSKIFIQLFHRYIQPNRLREQKQWNSYLPPNFLLHNEISFAENHIDSGAKAIYTDGSKTDEGTGSAYCILENYGIIASWQGKLDRRNSVFQAKILAFIMAIEAASSLHRPIKIWTDSLSSLMAILNPKSHHSMVREIQTLLLSHKHIHLRWLKAQVGYLGNECADQLAKEAITKGDPFLLPKPLSYLKSDIKSAALSIWQDNWDNGETGRSTHDIVPRVSKKPVGWNREEIMFVAGHGPFLSYLHRFNLRTHGNCSCGETGDPIHYATKCRFTLSWHFQTPTVSLKLQWLKNILTNNLSRTRLRLLMRFICDENNLIVEDNNCSLIHPD
ncbi:hypothetical protein AVEN_105-1 [Araneus ventricosus]|uniref:RNase H type-1 domain-containing protein n=1 Tax=Araneus ventricosus TaxID=182803 RepID=A0A4Y2D203_ARAVE|nr:hypothetical protein AVEN_105-1 [Araneus ventricosus]